jgi:hypothetical protein
MSGNTNQSDYCFMFSVSSNSWIGHGDHLAVGLITTLREDHLRELLRHVDVRLFEGAADQRTSIAGSGNADVADAGGRCFTVPVSAELREALRVVKLTSASRPSVSVCPPPVLATMVPSELIMIPETDPAAEPFRVIDDVADAVAKLVKALLAVGRRGCPTAASSPSRHCSTPA